MPHTPEEVARRRAAGSAFAPRGPLELAALRRSGGAPDDSKDTKNLSGILGAIAGGLLGGPTGAVGGFQVGQAVGGGELLTPRVEDLLTSLVTED